MTHTVDKMEKLQQELKETKRQLHEVLKENRELKKGGIEELKEEIVHLKNILYP